MNFSSQIFFNDINHGYRATILKKNSLWLLSFFMAMATYSYYEKVRKTMCTAIVSYLLKRKLFGPPKIFSWVLPLLKIRHCSKLSSYAISSKVNELNLKNWQKKLILGPILAGVARIWAHKVFL